VNIGLPARAINFGSMGAGIYRPELVTCWPRIVSFELISR